MECGPCVNDDVDTLACPEPFNVCAEPRFVLPSLNCNVPDGVPVPDAGVTVQTLHLRFGTKDELFVAAWAWAIVIVGVAFALRLAWLLYAKSEAPQDWLQAGDQYSYWYYGNEIAAGHGYVSYVTNQPTAYYPIGYPALLASLFFV